MSPEISVVIPTYNRLDVLPEVLAALAVQQDAPDFEVLVVDDGSTDGTADWLAEQRTDTVRTWSQANQGPAAARNFGVREARGRRIAFLGDDTVPSPSWLATHHRAAAGDPSLAVIGYTDWHPRMRVTSFMRYINEHGLQFGYALIDDRQDVPFNFLYTSNVTLPCRLLDDEPFDLRFPYPAWEDIELSYRLQEKGLRLSYEPRARVAHDHPTTIRRFCDRQEKAGYSAVVFYLLHPELGEFLGLTTEGPPPLPPAIRQLKRELRAIAFELVPLRLPELWEELLRYHYIRGLHRGWRDRRKLLRT